VPVPFFTRRALPCPAASRTRLNVYFEKPTQRITRPSDDRVRRPATSAATSLFRHPVTTIKCNYRRGNRGIRARRTFRSAYDFRLLRGPSVADGPYRERGIKRIVQISAVVYFLLRYVFLVFSFFRNGKNTFAGVATAYGTSVRTPR